MFETVFIGVVLGILCIGSVFSDGNDFDLLAEESQLYDQGKRNFHPVPPVIFFYTNLSDSGGTVA